ncbi:MAG: hypothetical protein DCF16_14975 [Alphaproteobacteria bacterium]|nr:MAG: hypothetical protein DCF16_14975 [Alphaproteobacteria bacterium]
MVLTIPPIVAFLLTLTLAALRRPRWTLVALLGAPALLWLVLLVLVVVDAASGCSAGRNCWYGIEYGAPMLFVAAAAVSLSWLIGGGLGWLIGWLLSRRKGQSRG